MHYGKEIGGQTYILGADISSFLEVLGLHVQVKRRLDIWNSVYFTNFLLERPLEPSGMLE